MTPNSTPGRRRNAILIGLFMVFLWLPTLDTLFHIDWSRPPDENRALASWPKAPTGWRSWPGYVGGLEAYFNDHFGCRKSLVQWQNKLSWSVFRERQVHNTLAGKDGWFFLTESQMIEHHSGEIQLTEEQLRDWQRLLEKRRDWLARQGIDYLFIIAPDKHTIYPEELPDWFKKVRPETTVDQFYNYMRAHSTVHVLDLRETLFAAKKVRPVYLKNDTHWNNFAGFATYQQLTRTLAAFRPDLKPLPISSFTVASQPEPQVADWWATNQYWLAPLILTNQFLPGADLTRNLGLNLPETTAYFLSPKMEPPPFTTKLGPTFHNEIPWFTVNPQAEGKIVIFRDSFASAWIQFLGYHFNKVTYVWQYHLDAATIIQEKPRIVVSEMLERFFNVSDPKKLMVKDALN
jgi:alginate O-acetyltransferase complex protein AlgJ